MCIPPTQKLDRQMDELLKEQLETTPKIRDRKLVRSMTPETRDLIKLVLESRSFFDEKEDFPEEEDMRLDPVIEAKFSAKTVSTSKSKLPTQIVQNDQPNDLNRPVNNPFIYFTDPAVNFNFVCVCVCVCVCVH